MKFIISRVPEQRLKNDLYQVLNKKIQVSEINHGERLTINPDLSVEVFLSGPILTDSAILIKNKNDFILNINDSKQQKLMLNQIRNSIGDGNLKVMLRSHSSANSRICIRNRDGSKKENNDKSKEIYSREFLNAASFFKPKVAIPFASNMCYLHKDTFSYNIHSNTSDLLYKYFKSSKEFKNIHVKLVLPGVILDLASLKITINQTSRDQLFDDRENELQKYRQKFLNKLERSEALQDNIGFSEKIIINYFNLIFSRIPFFIRILARGKIAFHEKNQNKNKNFFIVDILKKKIFFNKGKLEACHTIIYVSPGVLNSSLSQKNLNSLGISKLLDIHTESTKKYNYFFMICIAAEIGSSPFISLKQFFRFFLIWAKRWREILDYLLIIFKLERIR